MKAKIVTGQPPGGNRSKLSELAPLSEPILVQFFPIYACNFKCNYCTFSTDKSQRDFISDVVRMDINLYKKCIDDLSDFNNKIKVIRFVGMGEPLLHNKIVDMVQYASDNNVAQRIEILTNGSLLTHKMSDSLIEAGLDRLIISLQGTSAEKYKEVCDTGIDFKEFISNIEYFYNNKRSTQIHLKIIDLALFDDDDDKRFFDLFGDICDTIGIEMAGPIFPNVDYDNVLDEGNNNITQFGRQKEKVVVCPQPFFTMQINPDGNVVPCYSVTYPEILGNCKVKSLIEIWSGQSTNQFRLKMLDGIDRACNVCKECNIVRHRFNKEDDLSSVTDKLKNFYNSNAQ